MEAGKFSQLQREVMGEAVGTETNGRMGVGWAVTWTGRSWILGIGYYEEEESRYVSGFELKVTAQMAGPFMQLGKSEKNKFLGENTP